MAKLQFRVLFRQFLFRMVDVELLSPAAQGDINGLLGKFAALLLFLSLWLAVIASGVGVTSGSQVTAPLSQLVMPAAQAPIWPVAQPPTVNGEMTSRFYRLSQAGYRSG